MKIGNCLFLAALVVAQAACANPDADTSVQHLSKAGLYDIRYEPWVPPVRKRTLHAWTFDVRTANGKRIEGANLSISGGMPARGNGLPTQPFVNQALGQG